MHLKKELLLIFSILVFSSCQLTLESPTLLRGFSHPASSEEVIRFSQRAASQSDLLTLETIGQSETGIPLVAIKAANSANTAENPLRVLIFAQQHGNEQSGKEAALLLISDLAKGKHSHWLQNMEIWIVPQVNPDGSDVNQRRNAGGIDLNRDHVVQLAPETRALHALFNREMHHVTIDMHEYQPFRETWEEFGAFKTFDLQVGVPTNPNVSEEIRSFALTEALPAIEKHINTKGFSFNNYIVGPVPTEGRTRHSTVDFDDGRQSFAILGTLAFIYEGINGPDGFVENLESRTYGQYEALIAMLDFLHEQQTKAVKLVNDARKKLKQPTKGEKVAIRMEHFPDTSPLLLPLTSSKTGLDTLVIVENYHPLVKPTLEVTRPEAYLVPRNDSLLIQFIQLHQITIRDSFDLQNKKVQVYKIEAINKSEDEELPNRFPEVILDETPVANLMEDYLYVPTAQLHSIFLVSLFEPQSMLGLAQRPGFEYLLKEGTQFPVIRVE